MLTITYNETSKILNIQSSFPYGERIKKLPGARWNPMLKMWQIGLSSLDALCKDFKGELYFKTPLWEIKGEPAPDIVGDYQIDERITLPETRIPLYPYQKYGAKFVVDKMTKHNFAICADGVGLGKTPTAITVMKWFSVNRNIKKVLLIVKKSIKNQWSDEIEKFSDLKDSYSVFISGTTKKKREKAYEDAKNAEKCIIITNYHNFLNDTAKIQDIGCDFAIIDEAHCVKSREGIMNNNIAKAIRNIPTLFLTGTPVMSRPSDIFGIISMSDPYYFDEFIPEDEQWKAFKARYIVTNFAFGHENIIGARNLDELRSLCQDVTIRRTEHEVAINMPSTIEKVIKIEPDETQSSLMGMFMEDEKTLQDSYSDIENLTDEDSIEQKAKLSNLMKGMLSIKQIISTDPAIMGLSTSKMVKPYIKEMPKTYDESPKTEAIIDTVSDILESGEKVILFSKYVTVGKYISQKIEKKLKVNTLMYTGEENDEKRTENVNLFRNSPEYNVLIGTDAMAEGLNLAQARHIINVDLPDTYAIYIQRIGRARRVSSKYGNVLVHNFITLGGYDENRLKNLEKNKNLDDAMIAADSAQSKVLAKVSNEN